MKRIWNIFVRYSGHREKEVAALGSVRIMSAGTNGYTIRGGTSEEFFLLRQYLSINLGEPSCQETGEYAERLQVLLNQI